MPSYARDARTLKVNYFLKLCFRLKSMRQSKVQYDWVIALIWLLKFSIFLEVNTWQQKETLSRKQVPIRSSILCLCLFHQRRWKDGKIAKCWRRCYWPFRFKSWNGLAIQIQTLNKLDSNKFFFAVNNVTRGNSMSVWKPLKHSKAWAWTEHPSTVKLVGVLQLGVSGRNPRHLHFWGTNSFSRKCQ